MSLEIHDLLCLGQDLVGDGRSHILHLGVDSPDVVVDIAGFLELLAKHLDQAFLLDSSLLLNANISLQCQDPSFRILHQLLLKLLNECCRVGSHLLCLGLYL